MIGLPPTVPSTFDEHIAAIVRDPENDALRSELSKWLHASDPDRASFVSLQLARAKQDRHRLPGHTEPSPDERALLARHEAAWTRLVAPYLQRRPDGGPACAFHRGLLAHITIDPEVFAQHGERLLDLAPIRHADFAPVRPGALPALLASETLARLDTVGFIDVGLDDDAVAAIAACPHLARCLYLDLSVNPLGPPAFAALAASPHLRQLLVVHRVQQPGLDDARTWHPGELVAVERHPAGTRATRQPMRSEGRALEVRHGHLPWLHSANRVPRLDARWFVDRGYRPVPPTPSPVPP